MSYESLPQGYAPAARLDLLNDRRQLIAVTAINLVLMVLLIAGAVLLGRPIHISGRHLGELLLKTLVFLGGTALYMVLHELVHGLTIRLCGAKPFYGFRTAYAYAGSHAYFSRGAYLAVALSPVLLWGAAIALLLAVIPAGWFWPVYLIQVMNLSGAAGDYYVTYRILQMPPDTLVQDTGTEMTFYTKTER